jgi:acetolactate synthase-1/2/3 large subunit
MIRQTQDQWLDGRYLASSEEGGLGFPDWERVPEAYGFETATIKDNKNVAAQIREVLDTPGPVFCNVEIRPDHGVIPQVAFGRPIEDSEPLLQRETFFKNMITSPMEISETI